MTHPRATSRSTRRGFTFLEAILGMALLGILAGAIFGVLGYAWQVEMQARQTLAAAEIANRVLISYINDPTSPRKLPEAIEYEEMRFAWSIETENITIRDANPGARVGREGAPEIQQALGSMEFVKVVTWLDDGTDASRAPGRTATFTVERVIDPFAFRGNDQTEELLRNPELQGEVLQRMMQVNGELAR